MQTFGRRMNERAHISILRRMAGQTGDAALPVSPLTTSRAVRLALVKAAVDAVKLVLEVASTGDELGRLDDLLAPLEPGLMLVALLRGDTPVGFAALDLQLRAAVLDMQTTGRLSDHRAADRAATRTDHILCEPLLSAFVAALPAAVMGTDYAGWADGLRPGDRIVDLRAAGLLLADGDYRLLRMQVQLGKGDRQGMLVLLLPVPADKAAPLPAPAAAVVEWRLAFPASIRAAPACLTARLHRFSVSLRRAQSFQVGDILVLPGCSVTSIQLVAADGRQVAHGRLGQKGGKRAVRITVEGAPQMDDLLPVPGQNPDPTGDPAGDRPQSPDLAQPSASAVNWPRIPARS